MLKILLFSPKGAGHHYYGPGMSAFRMYDTLDRDDVQISLAHGSKQQTQLECFHKQFFISEIVNKNIWLGAKFLSSAKRWIKQNIHRFDVVHCLTAFQHSFMFSIWCEREGVPAYIKIGQSEHTGFYQNSVYSRWFGLKKYRHAHANKISGYIAISEEIGQKLLQAGIDDNRIHRIPNGVDVNRFHPAGKEEKTEARKKLNIEDCFTVIFTGSFADRKNPYLIAKAFYDCLGNKNAQLLLVGPDADGGLQRKKIRKLIDQHQSKNIHLFDHVKEVEMYYKASDLFVLPSGEEGFSNSMLEAQASGLPAVVTKTSGANELIDESKNGMFTERNRTSIAHAMLGYFEDREKLKMHSRNAREIVTSTFNSNHVLGEHLKLFSKNKIKRGDNGGEQNTESLNPLFERKHK